jgi:hypothetical protein
MLCCRRARSPHPFACTARAWPSTPPGRRYRARLEARPPRRSRIACGMNLWARRVSAVGRQGRACGRGDCAPSMVGSYSSTKWLWISWMVKQLFPTPPPPTTTSLYSRRNYRSPLSAEVLGCWAPVLHGRTGRRAIGVDRRWAVEHAYFRRHFKGGECAARDERLRRADGSQATGGCRRSICDGRMVRRGKGCDLQGVCSAGTTTGREVEGEIDGVFGAAEGDDKAVFSSKCTLCSMGGW